MPIHFPLTYSLESGTHVTVSQPDSATYMFRLHPRQGAPRDFTYTENLHTKAEWDELLDYEQLEALRRLWLELEVMA